MLCALVNLKNYIIYKINKLNKVFCQRLKKLHALFRRFFYQGCDMLTFNSINISN